MSLPLSRTVLAAQKNLKCTACVHFKMKEPKPLCTFFKFQGHFEKEKVFLADANYCREKETLCGPYAKYFE